METHKKVMAVIAAYNEAKHITTVLKGVRKYLPSDHVIVVDDGSTDQTSALALEQGAQVLRNIINLGKGAALKTGCDYALQEQADIIIVLDADNQHDPNEIPTFLQAVNNHDIVFGYRKFNKNMPFVFKFGNTIIKYAIHVLYHMDLKDSQCGYRAFTALTYPKIRWSVSDYSLESEMIAHVGNHHLTYTELPIETIYADKYKGTTVLDGVKIVINLIMWRLR